MAKTALLLFASSLALSSPALAVTDPAAPNDSATETEDQGKDKPAAQAQEVFSTGVAKGRDRLDSATSTSA
ncbi:MAG: hypothetical protein EON59_18370, partial [Alphaproteobacteria bacterium]